MHRIDPTRPPDTRRAPTTPAPPPPPTTVTPHLALDDHLLRADPVLVVVYRVEEINDEDRAEERPEDRAGQRAARVLA